MKNLHDESSLEHLVRLPDVPLAGAEVAAESGVAGEAAQGGRAEKFGFGPDALIQRPAQLAKALVLRVGHAPVSGSSRPLDAFVYWLDFQAA